MAFNKFLIYFLILLTLYSIVQITFSEKLILCYFLFRIVSSKIFLVCMQV